MELTRLEDRLIALYEHHGETVAVLAERRGEHRDNCLCQIPCPFFHPDDREANCELANKLFEFDVAHSMVTPVWECKKLADHLLAQEAG